MADINFDVRPRDGSCFSDVNGSVAGNASPGSVTFNIKNQASNQAWVAVVADAEYPGGAPRLLDTPHLGDGEPYSQRDTLTSAIAGQTVKVTRWAPGFLGIPGDGGGEIHFLLPTVGDAIVNITVTG